MLEPWSNINYNIGSIFLVNNFLVQVKVILITEETVDARVLGDESKSVLFSVKKEEEGVLY